MRPRHPDVRAHLECCGDLRLHSFAVAALACGCSTGCEGHAVEHVEVELAGELSAPVRCVIHIVGKPSIPGGPCEKVVEMRGIDERAEAGGTFADRQESVDGEEVPTIE
jgi:hypothetical protein